MMNLLHHLQNSNLSHHRNSHLHHIRHLHHAHRSTAPTGHVSCPHMAHSKASHRIHTLIHQHIQVRIIHQQARHHRLLRRCLLLRIPLLEARPRRCQHLRFHRTAHLRQGSPVPEIQGRPHTLTQKPPELEYLEYLEYLAPLSPQ